MGTYTKVITRLTLKSDAPSEVVTLLQLLVEDDSNDWKNIKDFHANNFSTDIPHLFFTNQRWYCIFCNFTDDDDCKSEWIPPRSIDVVSSVKNYHGLVDHFYNWIKPYIDTSEPHFLATIGEDHTLSGKRPMHILASSTSPPKVKGGPYMIVDDLPEDTFIVADANSGGFEPSDKHVTRIVNDLVKAEDRLWSAKAMALIENAKERASKAAAKRRRKIAKASQRRNRK